MTFATFENKDDGVEARVTERADGQWAVSLMDIDTGEFVNACVIYPADRRDEAVSRAKDIAFGRGPRIMIAP